MSRDEILNYLESLSKHQGFYYKLYQRLTNGSEESERYLNELVSKNFRDFVDLLLYIEQ